MDSIRNVYRKNKSSGEMKRTIRELKNKVYNYSEMEQMVREATCNDQTEPQVSLMREIAKGTFTVEFTSIMSILWKRIREEKNERHPLKCLILLEFLLREGNAEMVLAQIQNNLHLISALTNFRLINDQHIDVGMPVRERADRFLRFLRDDPTEEQREQGHRAPPPGFAQTKPQDDKEFYDVRFGFEREQQQREPSFGDAFRSPRGGGGGKFPAVVIKPKAESSTAVPALGMPASVGGGGARPGATAAGPDLLGDLGGGGGADPFGAPAMNDPFAASSSGGGFGAPAPNDPFGAPSGADPFGAPPNDPFSSGAPPPAAAPPSMPSNGQASLLETPADDGLLSLALPTSVMPGPGGAPSGLRALEGEDVLLSPNQRSGGHGLNCSRGYSAAFTHCIRAARLHAVL